MSKKHKLLKWPRRALFFVASLSLITIGGVMRAVAVEDSMAPGEVRVYKTAKAVEGKINTWDIELKLEARDSKNTSDVVLVMDRSGSMKDNNRLSSAKAAAKSLVSQLLANDGVRISLISFSNNAKIETNFISNEKSLNNVIDSLSASGGTYTQEAIHKAQEQISTSTADKRAIVLLSDGEPTYSTTIKNPNDYLIPYEGYGGQTSANIPQSEYNYSKKEGNGNKMYYCYYDVSGNSNDRYYNHGNSTIAEAGFAKAAGSTIYTVALSAGDNGNSVLNAVASEGNAYTSTPADLQKIFSQIANNLQAGATNINIKDVVSDKFSIVDTDGEVSGNTVSWSNLKLGDADDKDIRQTTKKIRIELAGDFTESDASTLYPTNESVEFKYIDFNGNTQTKTVESPRVNPVLIHTEKVVSGLKAFDDDKFTISVKDKNNTDFGGVFDKSGEKISNLGRETGAYVIDEVAVAGKYDVTYSYKKGSGDYQLGKSISIANDYQNITDSMAVDNDIYVRVINVAKLGSLILDKTLGDCSQSASEVATGKAFNFEIRNKDTGDVFNRTLNVSENNCHASVSINNLPQGVYVITEKNATEYNTTYIVDGDETVHTGKSVEITIGGDNDLTRKVLFNNRYKQNNRTITAKKQWNGGAIDSHKTTFELWRDGAKIAGQDKTVVGDTTVSWTVLEADIYGNHYNYTVKEQAIDNYEVKCNGLSETGCTLDKNGEVIITNNYIIPTNGAATAKKVWQNGAEDRPTIYFKLYRNIDGGEAQAVPGAEIKELKSGITEVTWSNLEQTDKDGNVYGFSVKEVDVNGELYIPENYQASASEDGLTITNAYVSPKINIVVNKKWDGGAEDRPEVKFQLYRDGEEFGEPVILQDNQAVWEDLDKTDEKGVEYVYSVAEVDVPENYEASCEGLVDEDGRCVITQEKQDLGEYEVSSSNAEPTDDNQEIICKGKTDSNGNCVATEFSEITVINTYVSPKMIYTVEKIWNGIESDYPEISIQLYRDGVPLGDPIILKDDNTSYTWEDLDVTDHYGKEYVYTVDEIDTPKNFVKYVDGNRITNTFVGEPGKGGVDIKQTSSTIPTELPETGSNLIGNMLSAAAVFMSTYIAVYFAQPKRKTDGDI